MATSVFSTWSDLYDSLLDRLASGDFRISQMVVAGKTFSFNVSSEIQFLDFIDRVKIRVDRESGKRVRRIYPINGRAK